MRALIIIALIAMLGSKGAETSELSQGQRAPQSDPTCNPKPPQTGAGCDVAGIQATIKAEISARGGVGRCYRTHAPDRASGRLLLRIVLEPDGTATSVDVTEDGLGKPGLATCLCDLLLTLRFPPPGDVPCTAFYPFNFE